MYPMFQDLLKDIVYCSFYGIVHKAIQFIFVNAIHIHLAFISLSFHKNRSSKHMNELLFKKRYEITRKAYYYLPEPIIVVIGIQLKLPARCGYHI